MADNTRTTRYLGVSEVGAWFGVSGETVSKWRRRYAEDNPIPKPDAVIGVVSGWFPEREAEWRAWKAGLPGQGAKGTKKPRKVAQDA